MLVASWSTVLVAAGAFLAGVGSALTGVAAYRRKNGTK